MEARNHDILHLSGCSDFINEVGPLPGVKDTLQAPIQHYSLWGFKKGYVFIHETVPSHHKSVIMTQVEIRIDLTYVDSVLLHHRQ